ncbi:MAG TPA: hypothetical protein VF651_10265 [Gammaproteobacteria bacterium]
MVDEEQHKSIFDTSSSEGVTESERLLMRLCRKSFLSLWSYANLHTDEGMHGENKAPKEFADVLVVFGNDVILFSDKHVNFSETAPLEVAWPRWRKRAIDKSVSQLYGALHWLKRFPSKIFLDPRCERQLPIALPSVELANYHLVAVTRGTAEACARNFPGSLGTLLINTEVENIASEIPFTTGKPAEGKPFVHVFDELALEIVLNELDTITDFVRYLNKREQFLSDPEMVVMAPGEEQLVAAYITNMTGDKHYFVSKSEEDKKADLIAFDESYYDGLISRPEYKDKKRAELDSYTWDQLIEKFIKIGDPKAIFPEINQDTHDTEQALRVMASESRFRRRVLVDNLKATLHAAAEKPTARRARVFSTRQEPNVAYIFLFVPKRAEDTYETYRHLRAGLLMAYCRCSKLKFPDANIFIGLGFDHPVKDYPGVSEDLVVHTWKNFDQEARAEAENIRNELGILGDELTYYSGRATEFPNTSSLDEFLQRERTTKAKSLKAKQKRKRKEAKRSRRRNRK